MIRFTRCGHSISGRFIKAGAVSYSLFTSSSLLFALVPTSAWFLLPLTRFHFETTVVSGISATRLTTNTCCLQWEQSIHCNAIVESDQKLQYCIFISCPLTMCSFNLTVLTAACISNRGFERCLIGATLHLPMTNFRSIEYSFDWECR